MYVTYFTFRSNISVNTVDCRVPKKSSTLKFSLRLSQFFSSYTLQSAATPLPVLTSPSVQITSQPVTDLAFTLGNLSNNILSGMKPDQFRKLVINARNTITDVPSIPI